ncbi:hypothetical protein VTN00DRAFT_2074 [Thermoascus crustaceus]|uniref:uncharacterized protein n=1 Tax=Thermoascus crustaceus TaxID=5088 RepID=UPI003742FC41
MRAPSLFGPAAAGFSTILRFWPLLLSRESSTALGASFTPIDHPDLDLSPLGRVALTGDFDAISLYSYAEQSEDPATNNGSQSLVTALPNGVLATLSTADADILAMCPFTRKDGTLEGLVVGGNFTSLGGIESQGIAFFDPTSNSVTAIPGLSGLVWALLCDQDTNTVYVGGDFKVSNSSNAAAWDGTNWKPLPFDGFNGPVRSILKADNGHIIFGGSFDSLGNSPDNDTSPDQKDQQVINLQTAKITSDAISPTADFSDPRNIICKTSGQDGPGDTWLLHDYSPGFWRADMNFEFHPTKLRLYNTHLDGRGTKTFLYRALPDNGIMNLTYTDPASGQDLFCDAECPLSDDPKEKYRDFRFVNRVGMSGFMLEIQDWYGQGAGLNGLELFQDDIFAYAVDNFNEPTCANVDFGSKATTTGSWSVTASGQSSSDYLSAQVTDSDATSTSVTFEADIKKSGNYSVKLFTPGCIQDGTCQSRGIVNVTATFATGTDAAAPLQTLIYQTNNFDKYDTIYTGYVDASSSDFRASVTLTPKAGQGNIDVVASRVGFQLISSTGGLNGLYEYNPSEKTVKDDFEDSAIDQAGTQLGPRASITSLATHRGVIYAAGNFSSSEFQNIMYLSDGNATSLADGGLNSEVNSMLVLDDMLYVGGDFTGASNGGKGNLKGVAVYSFSDKTWSALGGGIDGRVTSIQSLSLNISDTLETTVAVSGVFDQILPFGNNSSNSVPGFAIWVPSQKNWLQNLDVNQMAFSGQLTATAQVKNTTILAGSIASNGIASSGAVSLTHSDGLALQPLPIKIGKHTQGSRPSLTKRDIGSQHFSGVITGIFEKGSGRNLTILGGQFNATATNGSTIENLLFLDSSNDDRVTGLAPGVDSNSTFLTLAVEGDTLFAGGTVTGSLGDSKLNGFVAYDLADASFLKPHPPPLTGPEVAVNSIAVRPDSSEVYFGGTFEAAGSLPCPSVCFFDRSEGQWNRPGVGLKGMVSTLRWSGNGNLIAAGNLMVSNNQTLIATYNPKEQTWSSFEGASPDIIPGPITALSPGSEDVSQLWIAGKSSDDSSFLIKYDGSQFHSVGNIFGKDTTIRGIQVFASHTEHDGTAFLNKDQLLLITGRLVLPDFGNASAALFNGTSLTPFILSSTADGQPGSISQLFTENKPIFSTGSGHLSDGLVVLISFCLALGCVFLIVVLGIIFNKIQRRRQGYVRAPQTYKTDRPTSMRRVPPEYLFNSLGQHGSGTPGI